MSEKNMRLERNLINNSDRMLTNTVGFFWFFDKSPLPRQFVFSFS